MGFTEQVVIAPSLLSADFGHFAEVAMVTASAGAEYLHFDVMDGHFVPNITFGMPAVKALRPLSRAFFDVHLMIAQPERYVEAFASAGADGITVHVEACPHLDRVLAQIRGLGKRAGVALNPATPPNFLPYVLDKLDLVLVMTVNPGYGGQEFLPSMLDKINIVRRLIESAPHPIHIEVDGGIDVQTAPLVVEAGATALVAGTSLFEHPNGITAGVQALRASYASEG
jgi:ribulose-phosphate 3-epimerase